MPVSVKVGGAWKTATAVFNKVGGVWKTAADMPVKIAGVWKTGILESGAFESIATITGNGSSGTITFSSIPSTYKSLQIRYASLISDSGLMNIRFNGVSTSTYAYHVVAGEGNGVFAANGSGVQSGNIGGNAYGVSNTWPNVGIVDIHDYASTTKAKTVRAVFGDDRAFTKGEIGLYSSLWTGTAAVNSVTIFMTSGNFNSNTVFSLYGVK